MIVALLFVVPAILIVTGGRSAASSSVVTILAGSASVAHRGATFGPAVDGELVTAGDRVQTAPASHAVITFFDGSTLELEPDTTVTVEELSSANDGAIAIRISQSIGRTWSSVHKLVSSNSRYEVKTPSSRT